jgi:hypothetical protein
MSAPRKSPNGLGEVLYIRISAELRDALDARVKVWREANPGHGMSRSDLVREILYQELWRKGSTL